MSTSTLSRTTHPADPTTPTDAPTGADRAKMVRRLRELHAYAGQVVAAADWTPDVELAVHELSTELRRTITEVSSIETSVPFRPGDGTPPVVRLRELGVLHRRLTEALRGAADPDPVHRATIRTSALVGGFVGTLA